jgi:phage anti-repressor protein
MITFLDFLKKYSTIPNQFLDDYYSIINSSSQISNAIDIDLDIVIKWLGIQKHGAKNTLIKSYKKNIDYTINKVNKPTGKGGQKKEVIMISKSCFKKMCQLTKSKKGNEIREYFIQVELLSYKYKDYIINGMQEKIDKLEKVQK